jgi:hypothetical protein
MRRTGTEPVRRCTSCGKPAPKPKKGLCAGCYLRGYRRHTLGSECRICGTRDQRVLRRHVLAASTSTLCANHSAIAGRRKITLTELRAEVYPEGDRRHAERRRSDRRGPRERRQPLSVPGSLGWPARMEGLMRATFEEDRRKGKRR